MFAQNGSLIQISTLSFRMWDDQCQGMLHRHSHLLLNNYTPCGRNKCLHLGAAYSATYALYRRQRQCGSAFCVVNLQGSNENSELIFFFVLFNLYKNRRIRCPNCEFQMMWLFFLLVDPLTTTLFFICFFFSRQYISLNFC